MHGPKSSLARAWYRLTTQRRLARNEWAAPYWEERAGERIVACRRCPKFDAGRQLCGVPFGSPLRKCVVAATEAHLRATRGQRVLELGYARRSYGKRIVELAGGSWTGVEPLVDRSRVAKLGSGGYGHAGDIPFPDGTFDVVFGNQSFEHWEEPLPNGVEPPSYADCLAEIWRVLRAGGTLYLDAPIHLHGHEMFVAGDVPRIVSLFAAERWADVTVERWRYEHDPLPRYPTPAADVGYVHGKITSYDLDRIADLQANGTVWLLTVTARKR
jgi:SAM-dependent methyltransferase